MGFFDNGKKAAKFTFISMPMAILGVNQLKLGNQQIRALWRSNFSPTCPDCERGVLLKGDSEQQEVEQSTSGEIRVLHRWACTNCGFAFLDEADIRKVRTSTARYRNERVKLQLTQMERDQMDTLARSHRLHSRCFFVASVFALLGSLYMIASGAGIMVALNWLSIGFMLWVFGMKKSYRSWQVTSGQLFVDGAFWFWFQTQRWII